MVDGFGFASRVGRFSRGLFVFRSIGVAFGFVVLPRFCGEFVVVSVVLVVLVLVRFSFFLGDFCVKSGPFSRISWRFFSENLVDDFGVFVDIFPRFFGAFLRGFSGQFFGDLMDQFSGSFWAKNRGF